MRLDEHLRNSGRKTEVAVDLHDSIAKQAGVEQIGIGEAVEYKTQLAVARLPRNRRARQSARHALLQPVEPSPRALGTAVVLAVRETIPAFAVAVSTMGDTSWPG